MGKVVHGKGGKRGRGDREEEGRGIFREKRNTWWQAARHPHAAICLLLLPANNRRCPHFFLFFPPCPFPTVAAWQRMAACCTQPATITLGCGDAHLGLTLSSYPTILLKPAPAKACKGNRPDCSPAASCSLSADQLPPISVKDVRTLRLHHRHVHPFCGRFDQPECVFHPVVRNFFIRSTSSKTARAKRTVLVRTLQRPPCRRRGYSPPPSSASCRFRAGMHLP